MRLCRYLNPLSGSLPHLVNPVTLIRRFFRTHPHPTARTKGAARPKRSTDIISVSTFSIGSRSGHCAGQICRHESDESLRMDLYWTRGNSRVHRGIPGPYGEF